MKLVCDQRMGGNELTFYTAVQSTEKPMTHSKDSAYRFVFVVK